MRANFGSLFLIVVSLVIGSQSTECIHADLLEHLPESNHDSWCKVLNHCLVVGTALLGTALNCTTANTLHIHNLADRFKNSKAVTPDLLGILSNNAGIRMAHGSGASRGPAARYSEVDNMCKEPICIRAVQMLYDVAISTPEWRFAFASQRAGSGGMKGGLGFSDAMKKKMVTGVTVAGLQSLYPFDAELAAAVGKITNAAEAQLRQCLKQAEVNVRPQ